MANKTISGCRSVALHCVLEFVKKRMKRSSALSTLQNGIFRKGALRFLFCYFHIITSYLLTKFNILSYRPDNFPNFRSDSG